MTQHKEKLSSTKKCMMAQKRKQNGAKAETNFTYRDFQRIASKFYFVVYLYARRANSEQISSKHIFIGSARQ
jgi:hypothetical protein